MPALAIHPEQLHTLIQAALRTAATAPTVFDALDVTGAALRKIQELAAQEFTADDSVHEEHIAISQTLIV